MNNQTFDRISDLISAAKYVAIVLTSNPSLDATAAALSLSLSLAKTGKKVDVLCPTQPTVSLGNLVGANKIRQNHAGSGGSGLVISLPYQQGAIEKISYDIVGERINLTVVPGPQGLNFTTEDISYQAPSQQADLLIAVGVPTEEEVSTTANDTQSPLINIDHTSSNNGYGTVMLVDPSFSSQSELMTKILLNLNAPIDTDIAQNLLSGIVGATDNFQKENTSGSAFEVAGLLMQKGAKRAGNQGDLRDDYIASQEAKITNTQPPAAASAHTAWPQPRSQVQTAPKTFPNPMPQMQPIPQMQPKAKPQPFPQVKSADSKKTPKDWFEPKIYKGSRSAPMS